MNTASKTRSYGFTLIELLIAVVVLSVLISLAVPGFRIWLQNAQIRNAAESILSGLQRARAEAVLRNANVTFALGGTNDSACQSTSTCSSWTVVLTGTATVLDSRNSSEGSADVVRTTLPAANMTTVTYNNVGGRVANPATDFASITLDSKVLPSADSRELMIVIGVGGNARMCDPNVGSGPSKC